MEVDCKEAKFIIWSIFMAWLIAHFSAKNPPSKTEQVTFGIKPSLSFQIFFLRNSINKYHFVAL